VGPRLSRRSIGQCWFFALGTGRIRPGRLEWKWVQSRRRRGHGHHANRLSPSSGRPPPGDDRARRDGRGGFNPPRQTSACRGGLRRRPWRAVSGEVFEEGEDRLRLVGLSDRLGDLVGRFRGARERAGDLPLEGPGRPPRLSCPPRRPAGVRIDVHKARVIPDRARTARSGRRSSARRPSGR